MKILQLTVKENCGMISFTAGKQLRPGKRAAYVIELTAPAFTAREKSQTCCLQWAFHP